MLPAQHFFLPPQSLEWISLRPAVLHYLHTSPAPSLPSTTMPMPMSLRYLHNHTLHCPANTHLSPANGPVKLHPPSIYCAPRICNAAWFLTAQPREARRSAARRLSSFPLLRSRKAKEEHGRRHLSPAGSLVQHRKVTAGGSVAGDWREGAV
jgi:hypothetical protein